MEKLHFKIHDWVTFVFEKKHIYTIEDIRTEKDVFLYNPEKKIYIFQLVRQKDGFRIEAEQEELLLIHRPFMMQNMAIYQLYAAMQKKMQEEQGKKNINPNRTSIDQYLDMYNDYKLLYECFGDEVYKQKMQKVLDKMEMIYR